MNTETTKKTEKSRQFSAALMARIDACAIIFMDEKLEKINVIANAKGIEPIEAARMYTIGALKRSKAQGIARNYREALELLEDRQAGDRGNPLTRTTSADNMARTIQRINVINAGKAPTENSAGSPDYLLSVDNGKTYAPHYPEPKETKTRPGHNIGKILGQMYTEWEAKEAEADPVEELNKKEKAAFIVNAEKNLIAYFGEYKSRLSKTSLQRLAELVDSKDAPGYITTFAKNDGKAGRRLYDGFLGLYNKFDHREDITGKEFIELVRYYC